MAFVAVFQPPADLWSAVTFIMLALFLGIGTGGVFAWVARRAPAKSVGSVTGIVAAAGGLGGYFPPLVMGATYNEVDNNYTIGLLLLVATALVAFAYTAMNAITAVPANEARTTYLGAMRSESAPPTGRASTAASANAAVRAPASTAEKP